MESPLEGVSAAAWRALMAALEVQAPTAVSDSGGLGSFDIRPRRLVELGYADGLQWERSPKGRQIQVCTFLAPWTQKKFLEDPIAQYVALTKSVSLYHRALVSGDLKKPEGMSVAGALAILHRGGRGALGSWPNLFEHTHALYDAAQGAF
jgi:hypothetical protein